MSSASSSSSPHPGSGSKPSGGWQPPTLEDMQAMLPQYRFESLLGRGGMGAVYKAVQASLDRPVAIKVLPGDLIDDMDAQFAERFKNEARTMAKMNHPSIVNVYDFGETQTGLLFIVMEFINGTDVAQMIAAQGKLPEDYALSITAHVCDALNYAHKNGVIHRDIKPANILINMDGAVKVADFGLAKQNDSGQSGLTKTNMAMGTPDFVAPEALIPGIPLDGRADLYAIGVMLYQMLTGEIPRGMWTMPGMKLGTDPRFDAIIGKAMQTDRECRYQSAAEIRKDLDTILTAPRAMTRQQPVAAPAQPAQTVPKPGTHGPRQPQGHKPAEKPHAAPLPSKKSGMGLFIGLGAAVVIAVVIAVGAFFAFKKPSKETGGSNGNTTVAKSTPVDDAFMQSVAQAATPEAQVDLVVKKLEAINGVRAGRVKSMIRNGKVTGMEISRDGGEAMKDFSPLAALRDLGLVTIFYHAPEDLSFLRGSKVGDITIARGPYTDVSVLRGLPLTKLSILESRVADWSVLRGKPLKALNFIMCPEIADLSFLEGMPLQTLHLDRLKSVKDYSVLRKLPLTEVTLDFVPARDTAILKAIPTLTRINGKSAAEFWASVASGSSIAAAPPDLPATQTLDLLALINPLKDRISASNFTGKNEWKREGNELVYQSDGKAGKVAPPVSFADCLDYEIELKAVKKSGNDRIHVDVPLKNGRIVPLVLNSQGRKVVHEKQGSDWGPVTTSVHVTIRVMRGSGSPDRIVIQRKGADAKQLADWSGDLDTLAKAGEEHPEFPKQAVTSIFSMKDTYAFQTFRLRVFDGEAKVLRSSGDEKAVTATVASSSANAINLLAGLDVKRAADEGNWNMKNGELHGNGGTTGVTFLKLAFDREVPAEYDFHIQFTRVAGTNSITQHVVLPDGQDVMWMMGGFGNTVCAWEQVEGAPGNKNPSTIQLSIANGRRYDCIVKVRENRVQVELDGKQISDHRTKGVKLDVFARWRFPNPRHLGVGCQNEAVFHRVELIPVGKAPVVAAVAPAAATPVPSLPPAMPPPSPPPAAANDPVSVKLADLEAKFQAAFERDAGAAYKAQLATLNTGYTAALDRELAAVTKAGKLDDALALREEKQRITDGKGLPPEDLNSLPEALKRLRGTWRGAEAGYAKTRDTKTIPLYDAYDKALAAFQTELTQQSKIDDALRVKAARDELVQRRGASAPPPDEKPASVKAPTPALTNSAAVEASSSWRKAAEWVLSVGGDIAIRRNGAKVAVKDAKDLPGGRFDIISITIDSPNGKGAAITDDDLTRFNGMRDIESVRMAFLTSVTGSGFAAFAASAESMTSFSVYNSPLQPQHMGFITQFKNLRMLELNNVESLPAESLAKIQAFKELTQLRLLGRTKLDDKAMLELAGLTKLTELSLPGTAITDAGLAALKGMKALSTVDLGGGKSITGSGFVHLAGAKELRRLKLFQNPVDDAALAHLSGLTNLQELSLDQTAVTDAGIRHLAPLKGLRMLTISAKGVTGATLNQLSGCKELTRLDIFDRTNPSGTGLNDAGLQSLAAAGFPKLTDLAIAKGGTTDAGLAHLRSLKLTSFYTNEAPSPDGLRHIAAISTLESLGLGRGALTDDGLAILADLKALKTLISDESQVTDAGLKVLQGMPALKSLTLKQSKATQAGFETLAKARPDLKVIK